MKIDLDWIKKHILEHDITRNVTGWSVSHFSGEFALFISAETAQELLSLMDAALEADAVYQARVEASYENPAE